VGRSAWFLVFGLVAALTESPERALVAAAGEANGNWQDVRAYHASVGVAALAGGSLRDGLRASGADGAARQRNRAGLLALALMLRGAD